MQSPKLQTRLRACLEILRDGNELALMLPAHVEAATSLLHLGLSTDARRFATASATLAKQRGNRLYYEASQSIAAMAAFQASLADVRAVKFPGRRAIRRLTSEYTSFDDHHRASALGFLGAWHALYSNREDALGMLHESRLSGQRMDSEEGFNLMFLADFRMAEATSGGQRDEFIHRATEMFPLMDERHTAIAHELIQRLDCGLDSSIQSRFASEAIQDLLHGGAL
jgi:hypothetical protein